MTEVQHVLDVGGDPLLSVFAQLAQEHQLSMSMTLHARGVVVCGLLIGRDAWLDELVTITASAGESAKEFGGALQGALHHLDLESGGDDQKYDFIHLKGTQFVSGGSLMPSSPAKSLWRGRISEVSAWSLGTLQS